MSERREWRLLRYFEGGVAEYADDDEGFWLRSDSGTLRDLDPEMSEGESVSIDRFDSAEERCAAAYGNGLCRLDPHLAIYGIDIGAVQRGRFGFWRSSWGGDVGGDRPERLVQLLDEDFGAGRRITLGLECPLSMPVPTEADRLGRAREGEWNRAWSALAGTAVLALGLQQLCWVLRSLQRDFGRRPVSTFRWDELIHGEAALHLWEAFVSGPGRSAGLDAHVQDARAAAQALIWRAVQLAPGQELASAVDTRSGLNLAATALVWAGLRDDVVCLHEPITVIKVGR